MQRIALALLGATLLSPAALAQSSAPSPGSSPMATTSSSGQFLQQAQAGQWRASKFMGVDIYGQDNNKIGDVNEVLIDKSGKAHAVVIGVGGFLGIGEKNVAVPFDAVQWSDEPMPTQTSAVRSGTPNTGATTTTTTTTTARATGPLDYPDHGKVSWTKEQLKAAPAFKYVSDASRDVSRNPAPPTTGSTNR